MDHRPPPHRNSTPPLHRTPPYDPHNTPPSTRDPRIHRRSVLDSEPRRNSLPPSPSTDERLAEFQSEFQRSMANLMETMQATQATMVSLARTIDQMSVRPPSPKSHRHPSKSLSPRDEVPLSKPALHHRGIPEAPKLAVPLFKQSEIKSTETIAPAPIVQDPVHRFVSTSHMEQVIPEMVPLQCHEPKPATLHLMAKTSSTQQPGNCNLSSFANSMMSNGHFEEFCSKFGVNPLILSNWKQAQPVAHQVFVEMTQPIIQVVDDESDGTNSQEGEATSKGFPESTPKFNHPVLEIHEVNIQKVSEFGVKFFDDEIKLKTKLCDMKNVQDHIMVFPVIDSDEASYFVEDDCELKIVNVSMIVLLYSQEIRRDGGEMERIGVG